MQFYVIVGSKPKVTQSCIQVAQEPMFSLGEIICMQEQYEHSHEMGDWLPEFCRDGKASFLVELES